MESIIITIITSLLTAGLLGLFRYLGKRLNKLNDQMKTVMDKIDASNDASKYLLKNEITQSCEFWLEKGYIYPNEAECLQEMETQYLRLGGNSYVKGKVEQTLALPMSKPKQGGTHA